MHSQLLLKSQRREVFITIQSVGLEPAEFKWEDIPSKHSSELIVSRLVHTSSGGYYNFDFVKGSPWCEYSPGEEKFIEESYPGNWDLQLVYANKWLQYLKRELETPDLWATIVGESAMMFGTPVAGDETNSLFTVTERERLSGCLEEIQAYLVSANDLTDTRLAFVEERLRYLEGAASRMGRKDWINLAWGALINIVVGVALSPDAARDLVRIAGSALTWVLNDLPVLNLSVR